MPKIDEPVQQREIMDLVHAYRRIRDAIVRL
jgi:hypothetical protein